MRALLPLLLLGAVGVLGALQVGAYPESNAASLHPLVDAAWHEPAVIAPHTQWAGFLRLRSGHDIVAASYQICKVGEECFAPPHAATRLDNQTFGFDTTAYLANGNPVDYEAGWRIGVKWVLTNATQAMVAVPSGLSAQDPECLAGSLTCAESHYLAFDMPAAPKHTPAAPAVMLLAVAIVAALPRRQRLA